ncbi:MAG TPA: RNase adapter RapZ [Candidatus Acidoferrales bacterium]|nr:RNase adapter RapZ [Candidatus Acidoferrales bacterium]
MAPSHTQQNRQLVILTGLSGSGKGSVLRTFEDLGFYCVDNLPVSFIPSFAELYMEGGGEFERAVLLVDAREGEQLKRLPDVYRKLRREYPATLVFIEASEQALARRFNETRRPHPMGAEFSIAEGIRLEQKQMAAIRALADVVIDTTKFTVHDLRQFIIERFQKAGRKPLLISLTSFGYRFGLPADADLVFDVRFLPNPYFVAKLRPYSGQNARVARYIRSFKQTGEFLRRIDGLLAYLIPHYIREGKSYLTVAFGCTGGRHRSVMMAEAVAKVLAKRGYTTKIEHRDLDRSVS